MGEQNVFAENELDNKLVDARLSELDKLFDDIEGKGYIESIFGIKKECGELLFHFSHKRFYIEIYEYCLKGHGYKNEVKKKHERDFSIDYILSIEHIVLYNKNIEIFGSDYYYIIPYLEHIEMIHFIIERFICRYYIEREKNEKNRRIIE